MSGVRLAVTDGTATVTAQMLRVFDLAACNGFLADPWSMGIKPTLITSEELGLE